MVTPDYSLTEQSVSWRSASTSRRWLYGTAKEKKCAILDVVEFSHHLNHDLEAKLSIELPINLSSVDQNTSFKENIAKVSNA